MRDKREDIGISITAAMVRSPCTRASDTRMNTTATTDIADHAKAQLEQATLRLEASRAQYLARAAEVEELLLSHRLRQQEELRRFVMREVHYAHQLEAPEAPLAESDPQELFARKVRQRRVVV